MSSAELVQIVTTCATKSDAQRLAAALLEQRLAACVQIEGPLESRYRWEGQEHVEAEFRLTAKTTRAAADAVIEQIGSLHPYDEPEILVLAVLQASPGYGRWVAESVRGP